MKTGPAMAGPAGPRATPMLQHHAKIKEFDAFEEEFLIHCHGILSPFKWVTKILQGDLSYNFNILSVRQASIKIS